MIIKVINNIIELNELISILLVFEVYPWMADFDLSIPTIL